MQNQAPTTRPCAQRRLLLQRAGAVVSLGITALPVARAAPTELAGPFAAQTFAEAISALGGTPALSSLITLVAPKVADDGAFVPITVSSALRGTCEIVLLVDGNPQPVAARFTIPAGTEPYVATRIRMAGNGTVYAAVRTDDGLYAAACTISVTVGGCGTA